MASEQVSSAPYHADFDYYVDIRWQIEKRGAYMVAGLMFLLAVPFLIAGSTRTWSFAGPLLFGAIAFIPGVRLMSRYLTHRLFDTNPVAGNTTSILHFSEDGVRYEHSTSAETLKQEQAGTVPWSHFRAAEISKTRLILIPKKGHKWGWAIDRGWFSSEDDWRAALDIVEQHLAVRRK